MSLRNAVIAQLGFDDERDEELRDVLQDIANHGADAGWNGFIYYSDTVKFAEDNLESIVSMARDLADDLGEHSVYSMIAGFNCLVDVSGDDVAEIIIGKAKHNSKKHDEYTQVMNALAWFALEEIAREFTDEVEGMI